MQSGRRRKIRLQNPCTALLRERMERTEFARDSLVGKRSYRTLGLIMPTHFSSRAAPSPTQYESMANRNWTRR